MTDTMIRTDRLRLRKPRTGDLGRCAELLGVPNDALGEIDCTLIAHWRPPPTDRFATLTVGIPWLTGTP